ncbi:MAG: hypothetical protein JW867_02950 [Candidatus Omnitrophica bacterium]|nr:hypothetical protein [Candidatus Omnitrophota bacterium]
MVKTKKPRNVSVKITLDENIYPLSTIYAASYVFLDRAYIYLDKNHKGKIVASFFLKSKKESPERLKNDFCNELINYAHYFDSLKTNAEVVKALMQRALFSVSPSLADDAGKKEVENLISDLEQSKRRS